MSSSREQCYDLVAAGNALVEITLQVDDSTLQSLRLPKGRMTLASQAALDAAMQHISAEPEAVVPAGAECNVATGCRRLGRHACFMGKVGMDRDGDFFAQSLTDLHVDMRLARGSERTGRILSLVTPDRERTMMTSLGDAANFAPGDLDLAPIRRARAAFLSAFSLQSGHARMTALAFADEARANQVPLALDLADALVIHEIPDVISAFVEAGHAELIFANAAEVAALQDALETDAIRYLCGHASVVIVKMGGKGAMAYERSKVHSVAAVPVPVVDTTGAGDAFASGFLMGRIRGYDVAGCLESGAQTAALAVSQFGSLLRPETYSPTKASASRFTGGGAVSRTLSANSHDTSQTVSSLNPEEPERGT